MGVNKVEINGETKLDLTQDTVSSNTLLKGVTAHDASGEQIEGTMSGDSNAFVITVTKNEPIDGIGDLTYTADKLASEIVAAINSSMQCYVLYANIYFPLTSTVENQSGEIIYVEFTIISKSVSKSLHFMFDVTSNTWTYTTESLATFPSSASSGQVLIYSTLNHQWLAYNIGTRIATDFTGIIKGASGKLAQAESGVDYMPPVAVTASDNGKIMKVVDGAWAAVEQTTEAWTFTLVDGSTVTKNVVVA